MRRLGYFPLDNALYEQIYSAIQEQYAAKQRLMLVFERNTTESIIYMPYKDEYELLIPNIDPVHNVYKYKTIKFSYEDGINTLIEKINGVYEKM